MRLTQWLMVHPKLRNVNVGKIRKHIGGSINVGKHKVFEPIAWNDKAVAMGHLMREQRNLEILSRPYLTPKEDKSAKADFLGMTEEELIDAVEWKANVEKINRNTKRFHMKHTLLPLPWIVKKEYMDRIGLQSLKEHNKLDEHLEMLNSARKWE